MSEHELNDESGVVVAQAPPKTKVPRKYKVIILNDDFTTFDFVVEVLCKFFHKSPIEAEQITNQVHHDGKGLAGVYSRDVAETKMHQANHYARTHGHPLTTKVEPE